MREEDHAKAVAAAIAALNEAVCQAAADGIDVVVDDDITVQKIDQAVTYKVFKARVMKVLSVPDCCVPAGVCVMPNGDIRQAWEHR